MLTRGDRQRLERLSAGVHRTVTIGHEIGLNARARNKQIADRTGITDRSVRRHARTARTAGIHMPPALPGRRPRTDYSTSRRGFRRRRGQKRPPLDPWQRAARAYARTGDDLGELVRIMRAIHAQWSENPFMTEMEAAKALRKFLDAGGRLGPEAERWWRIEVPQLSLEAAHTPWLAAASTRHLGPWIAHRRAKERAARDQAAKEARDAAYDRDVAAHRAASAVPPDRKAELRAAEVRLRGPP